MMKTKKIVAAAAIVVLGSFGAAGVASASDHHGDHGHGRGHDHGLVSGLLHTVGHLLRDL